MGVKHDPLHPGMHENRAALALCQHGPMLPRRAAPGFDRLYNCEDGMTPEHLVKQNRTKWRIIQRRELRAAMKGEVHIIPALEPRKTLDLARTAYASGYRAAMNELRGEA